jgi:uncharacterized protein
LYIEIDSLRDEPLHFRHRYEAAQLAFEFEGAVLDGPVEVEFVLRHKGLELSIDGGVRTSARMKCARCLKEFSRIVDDSYSLFYAPHPDVAGPGAEIELKYDEMDVGFYDGVKFDVDLMASERIAMALPMRALCRDDCGGLCFTCGKDLNEGTCQCAAAQSDSRMSALLEFRRKIDK